MKTKQGWYESRKILDEYLAIGDEVDEAMMCCFVEVLPPACYRANLIQIGEPYDHVNGRATFYTIYKPLGATNWMYAGHCHRGEWTEPVVRHAEEGACLPTLRGRREKDEKIKEHRNEARRI